LEVMDLTRQYKCPKCGVVVSELYLLLVSRKCPLCGSELQELSRPEHFIGVYYRDSK